jgi:hypothetical protein
MRIPIIVLVIVAGGCGSSVPDESANLQLAPTVSTSHAEKASVLHSPTVGDTTMHERKIEGKTSGITQVNQSEDSHSMSYASIPQAVTNDLASPEAGTRLRALEHWEQKNSRAPLDAVFEAMEDEDEAVRARANAIVEQRWAIEQNNEPRQVNR